MGQIYFSKEPPAIQHGTSLPVLSVGSNGKRAEYFGRETMVLRNRDYKTPELCRIMNPVNIRIG